LPPFLNAGYATVRAEDFELTAMSLVSGPADGLLPEGPKLLEGEIETLEPVRDPDEQMEVVAHQAVNKNLHLIEDGKRVSCERRLLFAGAESELPVNDA
jgi:hypothetical protein